MPNTPPDELEFPKVREDISYTPMVLRGRSVWIVKDPVRRKFMQFDDLSKRLCELCDGTRSLQDLKVQMEEEFPEFEFTEEYLTSHIAQFRKLKLVLRDRFEYNVLLIERERRDREKRNNILHMRFPAFNPDASLDWLLQRVRWVFSRPFVIFYLIVVIGSYLILLLELGETLDGLAGFYAFPGWKAHHILALYVTIIAIIVMHEYGHGLSCKYFGGEVPAMGILIIYVINPALYCNVSDSYRFPKKSSRIWVMAGGAVVEFFVGAIAVFVWWLTDPSLLIHSFAFKIVIFCSITSVLFNMNPLLKYDGYYILAEYLEIPNLRKRSFQYLGWIIRSKVFGLAGKRPSAEGRERLVFLAYAVAATIYSIMIFSLIFTLLKNWLVGSLEGLGWILTFLLMYLLLRKIILKGTGALRMAVLDRTGAVRRHLPIVLGVLALLIVVPSIIQLPTIVKGTGTLEPQHVVGIEAPAPGYVQEVVVAGGETVASGQHLLSIGSDSLAVVMTEVRRRSQRARLAASRAFETGDAVAAGVHLEEVERAETDARALAELQRSLQVSAPFSGTILTSRVHELLHRYVTHGEVLLEVAQVDSLRVKVEVHERYVSDLSIGTEVRFKGYAAPSRTTRGRIIAIDRLGEMEDPENAAGVRPAALYRVEMLVSNAGNGLLPGQGGRVRFYGRRRSVWGQLLRKMFLTLRLDFFI